MSESAIPREMRHEELERLVYRYKTDYKLHRWYHEIANLYSLAPGIRSVIKNEELIEIKFDERTEYEVERIRYIIADYLKTNYSQLFSK